MSEQIITKRCCHCKKKKPLLEFCKNKSAKDGLSFNCRICHNAQTRQYQQTEKGKKTAQLSTGRYCKTKKCKKTRKQYAQSKKGKKIVSEACKRYAKRFPERRKAKDAVNHAVTAGKLPKVKTLYCHSCMEPAEQYHHYLDYTPKHHFDVLPFCINCHKRLHSLVV